MSFDAFYEIASQIPKGKVATYADVARAAGKPKAARAVGNAMACNPDTRRVPCHRVVKSSGEVGGYRGNSRASSIKAGKLRKEGVDVNLATGVIRNFEKFRFRRFKKI